MRVLQILIFNFGLSHRVLKHVRACAERVSVLYMLLHTCSHRERARARVETCAWMRSARVREACVPGVSRR